METGPNTLSRGAHILLTHSHVPAVWNTYGIYRPFAIGAPSSQLHAVPLFPQGTSGYSFFPAECFQGTPCNVTKCARESSDARRRLDADSIPRVQRTTVANVTARDFDATL